jgi:uncharacterized protein (TIGR00730 family)
LTAEPGSATFGHVCFSATVSAPGLAVKRLCVFSGSSSGRLSSYAASADRFGRLLARSGLGLVYGGASIGLMGAVADAVLDEGGEVIGVIPRALVKKEVVHEGLPDLRVVDSMHERKALMANLADGFVALPGGLGTLEELCEILTWAQLGIHQKPVGLLDVDGYFQPLLRFLDHIVYECFMRPEHRAMVLVEEEPGSLIEVIRRYQPAEQKKWLDQEDA